LTEVRILVGPPRMKIEYKINDFLDLDNVLEFSKKIFKPTPQEVEESHKKEDWLKRLENKGILITAYVGNNLAGFALGYEKERGSLHIWQVGVMEEYRGRGIWRDLYREIEEYARNNDFQKITLNTYKDKFPVMYKFAQTRGFVCYKTELKNGLEKSFFEKKL